jgi:large subunit ribosomal protein L20
MPRVKRGTQHTKRRRNLLARVKGYKWGRKSKIKLARPAMLRAGASAFKDRRAKKRDFRRLWSVKINAAARLNGTTYSRLIGALKAKNIDLDRKILATLGEKHPEVFTNVVEATK